jgi:hypothetical protein
VNVRASSNGPTGASSWSGTFNVGDKIDLVQSLGAINSCEARQGVHDVTASASIGGPTDGQFELYTGAAGASFDYVFLVEVGGN